MKVYVLISGTTLPGKYQEARQAVQETVQYLNANNNYVGKYEVVRPSNGPNNQITWLCNYQSMADQEKDTELRGKDPEWPKIFEQVNETVDVDNVSSQVLQVLE
jgi:hypothetical protein